MTAAATHLACLVFQWTIGELGVSCNAHKGSSGGTEQMVTLTVGSGG